VGPFTSAIAGDEGRVAVAYLATPDTEQQSNDAPPWARWYLYLGFLEDALAPQPAVRTVRATEHPVQLGAICTRGIGCPNGEGRNLLDFIDVTVLPDGRVAAAFTDGCLDACVRGADSTGFQVAVAVQEAGPLLLTGAAPGSPASRPARGTAPAS
jgi:hypothetical protein